MSLQEPPRWWYHPRKITEELHQEEIQHVVVLVFAKKQDLKDAMTPSEISDALSLHTIKKHDWHIQACCALTGEGLWDAVGWISQHVSTGAQVVVT